MRIRSLSGLIFAVMAFVWMPVASADTATCQYREKGKDIAAKSGRCTFADNHGIITITLKDGEKYTLTPREKDDRYKDQKDRNVKMKYEKGKQVFSWEHRHISVSFDS